MRLDNQLERKAKFDRWCDYFKIEGAERDRMWAMMLELGMTPDDEMTFYLLASGVLQSVSNIITASNEALPAKMKAVGRELVADVSKAATVQATSSLNRMTSEAASSMFETVKAAIAETVASQRVKLGLGIIGAFVAVAVVAGTVGWSAGSRNVSGVATEWAGTVARNDSRTWLGLMAANPDIDASIRNYCGTGSPRARVFNGARACEVPVWLDAAPAPAATGTVAAVSSTVLDWLYGWGPLWLLGGGLLAGLLGRKLLRATVAWKPLRWILD